MLRTSLLFAALLAIPLVPLSARRQADAVAPPSAAPATSRLPMPATRPSPSISISSPLVRQSQHGIKQVPGITRLNLQAAPLATARQADFLRISDFPLSAGETSDMTLQRLNVFSPGAQVLIGAPVGSGRADQRMTLPSLDAFTGSIAGEPTSLVYLAFSDRLGVNGLIIREGRTTYISTANAGAGKPAIHPADRDIVLFDPTLAPADMLPGHPFICGTHDGMRLPVAGAHGQADAAGGLAGEISNPPCRVASLAIESDYEYTNLFGGDPFASAAYAGTLIGAISSIYQRDLNARLEINFLRLWTSPEDPWTQDSGMIDQLDQFTAYWNGLMTGISRTAAHFLSGRSLGGGVAYVGALCAQGFDYGLSANLGGAFPFPLQHNSNSNWDVIVVAHEIGHNFGAWHTHDLVPPPDSCGSGDCTNAANGTIMSYCHGCDGGLANIGLEFHPQTIQQSLDYLNTTCDLTSPAVHAQYDFVTSIGGAPILIDVLANDMAASCGTPAIDWFDTVTEHGGSVALSIGTGPGGRNQLLYTPAISNGIDTFWYLAALPGLPADDAQVTIKVVPFRTPENPLHTIPGVNAAYFALPEVMPGLPDFNTLNASSFGTITQLNLPSTSGNFAGSGLADLVGAVFQGFVIVPTNAVYTFYLESDDGSDLWIGNQRVVANDGLHGMVERSGSLPLQAGAHAITVRFYEAGGGAGLIARYSGGGFAKQVIPTAAWVRPIPADVTADGVVNIDDFTALVLSWGPCGPGLCPADTNHDGEVDIDDYSTVILNWD